LPIYLRVDSDLTANDKINSVIDAVDWKGEGNLGMVVLYWK